MSRLLGIDLGERRIGVALGDPRTGSARPLVTLARRDVETDAASLARLAREHDADELVVGLPLSLDGSEGPQAERTRAWAAAVAPLSGLSRLVAGRATHQPGCRGADRWAGTRPGRRAHRQPAAMRAYRARVDREAATAIVQAALDARRAVGSRMRRVRP